jgi:hypothetical protein
MIVEEITQYWWVLETHGVACLIKFFSSKSIIPMPGSRRLEKWRIQVGVTNGNDALQGQRLKGCAAAGTPMKMYISLLLLSRLL